MSVFVGRESELGRIKDALDGTCSGEGRLLLFAGEAGIGKTALAERAATLAAERSARAVWARCWEAGGAPPFWPWIEALGTLFPDDDVLAHADAEGDAARLRLFDRVHKRLRAASESKPLVLLFDDLHAADASTLLLLHFIARRLKPGKLSIMGTLREVDARLAPETGDLVAKIAREGEMLRLSRLDRAEVSELIRGGNCDAARVEEVHRASEGNPLFVVELLKLGPAGSMPRGLVAVLDEHLGRLSAEARTLLEAGAALGREFSTKDVAAVAGLDADAAFARLAEARASGVISTSGDRHAFVHMLFCERLGHELAPSRRSALQWRAGEACMARGDLARAAHHMLEGLTAGDSSRAVDVARKAIAMAMTRLAFEEAARLAERALDALGASAPGEVRCELGASLGEALIRAGKTQRGKEACLRVAREARASNLPVLEARAALVYASEIASGNVDRIMVDTLRSALAALRSDESGAALRARVLARLAAAMVPPKDASEAEEVLRIGAEATALARSLGDPETLLFVLQYASAAGGYLVGEEERFPIADEIVALAKQLDRPMTLVNVGGWHMVSLVARGRRAEAMAAFEDYRTLILSLPAGHYHWRLYGLEATLALLDADFDRAEERVAEMVRVTDEGNMSAAVATALLRIGAAHARGRAETIAPHAEEILRLFSRMPPLVPYAGWVLAAIGRTAEARDALQIVVLHPGNYPWLIIAGAAIVLLDDRQLAEPIHAALSKHAFKNRAFWGPAGTTTLGPTSRTLGDLAMVLGRHDEAVKHYDDAIAFCASIGARALLERSKEGRARALGPNVAAPKSERRSELTLELVREGDVWRLSASNGVVIRLKDAKGIAYLENLLRRAGEEIHVVDLVGLDTPAGDAGAMLDPRAKETYRRRLEDLQDELDEARRFGDPGRAEKAQAEIEAIGDELARGVGLGGRDRKAASQVERARINVQRRLRDVIERVREHDPVLGKWLAAAVKTGTYCSFDPV